MMRSLFSFEKIHSAYLSCRRGKRQSLNALLFEQRLEENLFRLSNELQARTYQTSPSTSFVTAKPKHREIFAAEFRDRVAHHRVVTHLEPIWERIFIHDSYAYLLARGNRVSLRQCYPRLDNLPIASNRKVRMTGKMRRRADILKGKTPPRRFPVCNAEG